MAIVSNTGLLESSRVASTGFTNSAAAVVDVSAPVAGHFRNLWAALKNLQGDRVVECPALECSDSDLNLIVPLASPMMVGQRYEISVENRDPIAGTETPVSDGQYATVFRTEVVSSHEGKALRVGLKLDQPLSF